MVKGLVLQWISCADCTMNAICCGDYRNTQTDMSILRFINTAGNLIPHGGRRFILDRLGLGRVFMQLTANQVEVTTLPNGVKMFYNTVLHQNVTNPDTHEPALVAALHRHLKPGSVFYDIGANIGLHSFVASSIVGSSGRVFAFEPNDTNLRYLRLSLEQEELSNITLLPIAIGKSDGEFTFDARGAMSGRLADNVEQAVNPQPVDVRSVDSLIAAGSPFPNVIKIDIEGGEGDALSGATETLKRHPTILCEMHGWSGGAKRAWEALERAGYRLANLKEPSSEARGDETFVLATKPE